MKHRIRADKGRARGDHRVLKPIPGTAAVLIGRDVARVLINNLGPGVSSLALGLRTLLRGSGRRGATPPRRPENSGTVNGRGDGTLHLCRKTPPCPSHPSIFQRYLPGCPREPASSRSARAQARQESARRYSKPPRRRVTMQGTGHGCALFRRSYLNRRFEAARFPVAALSGDAGPARGQAEPPPPGWGSG